ncbi:MAG: hypothetical protein JWM55_226 [Acidimicrobiaceae bacterium]|nr:hypothetical protein [Acidimicrobiaceae bacterium]
MNLIDRCPGCRQIISVDSTKLGTEFLPKLRASLYKKVRVHKDSCRDYERWQRR